uniref:Transmembrane protein n=1 Tax=Physcomitrium patens TaxID=3218 RepID=A0A2K1KKE1_PHYPA|nr:hypothetical protein PHYPA_007928 [Physcomitrium patens]
MSSIFSISPQQHHPKLDDVNRGPPFLLRFAALFSFSFLLLLLLLLFNFVCPIVSFVFSQPSALFISKAALWFIL